MPDAPDDGIDLVRRLLHFNPDKRPTADQILKHSYVRRYASRFTSIILFKNTRYVYSQWYIF